MKDEIAGIMLKYRRGWGSTDSTINNIFNFILKNIQVPVECPRCNGHGRLPISRNGNLSRDWNRRCPDCNNGWTTRSSTIEDLEEGGVLRKVKE
jgi:ssDNA-binding Zn-finger/Zn-ribbon topoisomerase 1